MYPLPHNFKIAGGLSPSDLTSLDGELLEQVCSELPRLFDNMGCFAAAFNLKRIRVTTRTGDGSAESGNLEWSITLQLPGSWFKKDAYVVVEFDRDVIYMPPLFKDQLGRVYAINETAVDLFLRAQADLSDHEEPVRPLR